MAAADHTDLEIAERLGVVPRTAARWRARFLKEGADGSSRRGGVLAGIMFAAMAYGQDKPARLTFEVASIRPSTANDLNGGIKALPGGQEYTSRNIPIKLIISLMYKVPMRQIEGGPEWLANDRYDIEAKADQSYNIDDLHVMFQNLLADRFKLKFHKEVREGNVYALTIDKPGSKMKVNESAQDFKIPINFQSDWRRGETSSHAVPLLVSGTDATGGWKAGDR